MACKDEKVEGGFFVYTRVPGGIGFGTRRLRHLCYLFS
jgi:hypothetical protein